MIKILIIGIHNSVYIKYLTEELNKRGLIVHIFDPQNLQLFENGSSKSTKFSSFPKSFNKATKLKGLTELISLNRILKKFRTKYDICNIHYNFLRYSFIANNIKKIGNKLIVTMYGSDFYRKNGLERKIQRKIYKLADILSFSTDQMKNNFLNYYGHDFEEKSVILRFGLRTLEYLNQIDKEKKEESKKALRVPLDLFLIACGYNASKRQNHKKIIASILNVRKEIPHNILLIFPMTYGDKKYKLKIEKLLIKTNLKFKIFDTFMSDLDIARLRKVTDIMINVQQTDQLSGSTLEHLYAGNIVITGSWLPYDILYEKGAFLLSVDSFKEIGPKVLEVLDNLTHYKKQTQKNISIISEISSWDKNVNQWIELYKSLVEKN